MNPSKNHYNTLGVHYKATRIEIRDAYRKLALKYHPDLNNSKTARPILTGINEAYAVLSNPARRKHYDLYELELFPEISARKKDIDHIYKNIVALRKEVVKMDRFRMDKHSVTERLMHLFSDRNIEIINNNNEALTRQYLLEETLGIIHALDYKQQNQIISKLRKVNTSRENLKQFIQEHKTAHFFEKYKFLIAVIATLILVMILAAIL